MDLSSMFQNLGPAGGAILTGMQAGDAANEQASQQAYRKAQMEDIMQRTSQQAELHPLELQSKQQLIDKGAQDIEKSKVDLEKAKFDLTVGKLKGAVEKADSYSQLMGTAAAQLVNIPPPARHAWLANFAQQNGIDANDPAVKSIWQQTSQVPPEKLPQVLSDFRNKVVQMGASYQSHMDGMKLQAKTQKDLEQMRVAAGKYNKNKVATDVGSMLLKAHNPTQKAEILESAYYVALDNDDTESASKYLARAKEARQRAAEDAKNRAIGAPGAMYDPTQSVIVNKPSPTANAPIGGGLGPTPENLSTAQKREKL
jgi:hypothetical protein